MMIKVLDVLQQVREMIHLTNMLRNLKRSKRTEMMFAEMSALTIMSLDIIMAERHTTITRVKVISSMEHFIKKINHRIFPCTCFLPSLFLHQKKLFVSR